MSNLDAQFPDPQTVPYRSLAIRTGGIIGLISIVLALFTFLTGMNEMLMKSTTIGLLWHLFNISIYFYFIYTALKHHRREDLGGYLSFGRCLGFGSLVGLVSGIIGGLWFVIFVSFVDTNFMQEIHNVQMQAMEAQGLNEDQIEEAMAMAAKFSSLPVLAIFGALGGVFFGFLGGLFSGMLLKRDIPMA